MSTFAKSSFNASVYSASRPTYPLKLFEYIFSFHGQGANSNNKPRWERAIDLGCGTGTILFMHHRHHRHHQYYAFFYCVQ